MIKDRKGFGSLKNKIKRDSIYSLIYNYTPQNQIQDLLNVKQTIAVDGFCQNGEIQSLFYSIQKGKEAELELKKLIKENWGGPNLLNFTDQIIDFSDTAAFISHLDLIISVDTSTAHLSAAMGKPTWILNRYDSCWRWFDDDSSQTPWYQSVKLFRQSEPNDWSDVIIELEKKLNKVFSYEA
jgi:ADP-heptose:LPS heptosyltransferase